MNIKIGSKNAAKCAAANTAVQSYWPEENVEGIDVDSGVSDMPANEAETMEGAVNRAKACVAAGADIGLGVESGMRETSYGLTMMAWAAAVTAGGDIHMASAGDIPLPEPWQDALRNGAEIRPLMLETGLPYDYTTGAVGFLTKNVLTRDASLANALRAALAPIANADVYQPTAATQAA